MGSYPRETGVSRGEGRRGEAEGDGGLADPPFGWDRDSLVSKSIAGLRRSSDCARMRHRAVPAGVGGLGSR